jgi:hypothetical protein
MLDAAVKREVLNLTAAITCRNRHSKQHSPRFVASCLHVPVKLIASPDSTGPVNTR